MAKDDAKKIQVRLLKVLVQPVLVVDDGENLQEVPVDPIAVPSTEWPTYAQNRFKEQLKSLQKQFSEVPAQE